MRKNYLQNSRGGIVKQSKYMRLIKVRQHFDTTKILDSQIEDVVKQQIIDSRVTIPQGARIVEFAIRKRRESLK